MSLLAGLSQQGEALTAHNDDAAAHGALRKAIPSRGVVTVFGNSISALGYNTTALSTLSKGAYIAGENYSAGGAKSAEVLAAIIAAPDVGDIALIQEGTNDAATGVSVGTHFANMSLCVDAIRAKGGFPVIITPPPNDGPAPVATNKCALVDHYLGIVKGVPVYDPWQRLFASDGTASANTLSDTIHPYKDENSFAGVSMYGAFSRSIDLGIQPRSTVGEGLFGSNTWMLTDSNADGMPDGWSAINLTAPVHALTPATLPKIGNVFETTVDQSADGFLYRQVTTGFSIGDTVLVAGNAGLSDSVNMSMDVFVRFNGSGVASSFVARNAVDTDLSSFAFVATVPSGTTSIQLYAGMGRVRPTGNYSGKVSLAGCDIYNITALLA